jgi:hypothetical protein
MPINKGGWDRQFKVRGSSNAAYHDCRARED